MSDTEAPIRPERKATLRLGQRELSRLSLAVVLVVVLGLLYGGYRIFLGFKSNRDVVLAQDNLHTLYNAMRFYSNDYDGKLPPAENWSDAVSGYLSGSTSRPGGRDAYLTGPGDGEDIHYVYNDLAAGYNFEPPAPFGKETKPDKSSNIDPARLPLLIERPGAALNAHEPIPPQTSMQNEAELGKLLSFPHGSDNPDNARTVILYADGHIDIVTRKDFKD